ncbi:MAG: helix-turn-helix transcriptional regulator [Acidobacteriota bacterium]
MDFARKLGAEIARKREAAGLTQRDLADRLGQAAISSVSAWETGSRGISVENLVRVARALGAHPERLLVAALGPDGTGEFVHDELREEVEDAAGDGVFETLVLERLDRLEANLADEVRQIVEAVKALRISV